jgi:hypothetical protein
MALVLVNYEAGRAENIWEASVPGTNLVEISCQKKAGKEHFAHVSLAPAR